MLLINVTICIKHTNRFHSETHTTLSHTHTQMHTTVHKCTQMHTNTQLHTNTNAHTHTTVHKCTHTQMHTNAHKHTTIFKASISVNYYKLDNLSLLSPTQLSPPQSEAGEAEAEATSKKYHYFKYVSMGRPPTQQTVIQRFM